MRLQTPLDDEQFVRRMVGNVLRTAAQQTAARHQSLVLAGTVALREAVATFNPSKHQKLSTHIKARMHAALFAVLRTPAAAGTDIV